MAVETFLTKLFFFLKKKIKEFNLMFQLPCVNQVHIIPITNKTHFNI